MTEFGNSALVIATIGYGQGHLSHHVFVALILTITSLALLGPLMMTPFSRWLQPDS